MALVNINADMRSTAKALGRIANVLERIATQYMGITLEEEKEPAERTAAEEVGYTSDRQEIRREIAEKLGIGLEPEDDVLRESS